MELVVSSVVRARPWAAGRGRFGATVGPVGADCAALLGRCGGVAQLASFAALTALGQSAANQTTKPLRARARHAALLGAEPSPGELLQLLIRIFEVIHLRAEKKNAEEYLRDSEEKYRTLVNNVNVGVYRNSGGPYGQFIQVNPAMIRIFGYDSIEEFMKIPVADLYQDPNERKRYIEKIQAIGSVKDEELRMKKRNGMPIWVSVTARV